MDDTKVEVYDQDFHATRKTKSLSNRFEGLCNKLGLGGKESTALSKITFLQQGLNEMKILMD
eukprot:9469392-Ditylum_brightwellii.AAC.1